MEHLLSITGEGDLDLDLNMDLDMGDLGGASSIPVTLSMRNPQVKGPGVLCCLDQ